MERIVSEPGISVPVVVTIGEAGRVEVGVEVGVIVADRDGDGVRLVVDEDQLARSVAEALLLVAATVLDARADSLADVVGDALDAFDDKLSSTNILI